MRLHNVARADKLVVLSSFFDSALESTFRISSASGKKSFLSKQNFNVVGYCEIQVTHYSFNYSKFIFY